MPHHDKVVTPYRAETSEFGPIFVSLGILLALFLYTLVFYLILPNAGLLALPYLIVLNIGILALFL